MKVTLFLIFLVAIIGDIYTNYKVYKIEKEVSKKIEENIIQLKERKVLCTNINCNIERAIKESKNVKSITIKELAEKVAEELRDGLQKHVK